MRLKLAIVAVLVLGITILGIRGWMLGTLDVQYLWLVFIGGFCGVMYLINGGSLPEAVAKQFAINADDDASNISTKIYVPILLFVILAAIAAFVLFKP